MNGETIKRRMAELPLSPLGELQGDDEIWEEIDGNAHFKVTRHRLPPPANLIRIISLSVSGDPEDRARVINQFIDVLGDPVEHDVSPKDSLRIDIVLWQDTGDSDMVQ